MDEKNFDRRSFFRMAVTAAVIVPVALKSIGKAEAAPAASCPTTPPAGKPMAIVGQGMAKGLEYTDDGKSSTNAKHKPGQNCANCKYFNDKKGEGGYAPCTMMGMKWVTNCGWCKSYAAR
ncbi:MAG: high-potential iron-sulfur protein [Rhizobacter sp.]|nr:high-potential iron-sulfur protein [Bacteriovorax sp.]